MEAGLLKKRNPDEESRGCAHGFFAGYACYTPGGAHHIQLAHFAAGKYNSLNLQLQLNLETLATALNLRIRRLNLSVWPRG